MPIKRLNELASRRKIKELEEKVRELEKRVEETEAEIKSLNDAYKYFETVFILERR
jgi:hypothetical protein